MRFQLSLNGAALSLAILALLLFGAYAFYWHSMAQRLQDGLQPWSEAQRAHGYDAHWDDFSIDGFPSEFRLRFKNASFGAERPLPARVTAPSLTVWAAPWNLHHWQFTAPDGAHADSLDLAGFDLARFEGSAQLGAVDLLLLDAIAFDMKGAGLAAGTQIASATAHIDVPMRAPASHRDVALTAVLELSDMKLPVNVPSFGDTVAELAFAAQLKGGLPPGPLVPALTQWRNDGGTVELQSFRLHWGALLVDASGTLALDDALQPEGAFSAVITGQDAAIDLAVGNGVLPPSNGNIAKAVLGLLAKPGANGEKAITVPLSVQQSWIFIGPAAIADMPRIKWE